MPKKTEIYKCKVCGNIVMVMHGEGADLVCCGENMTLMVENTMDAAKEKHVPMIEQIPDGYRVRVGATLHPMEEKHWIEWIELVTEERSYIQYLQPGQAPEASFLIEANRVSARAYCNLHGLWKA